MPVVAFRAQRGVGLHGICNDSLVFEVSLRDLADVLDLREGGRFTSVKSDAIQVVAELALQLVLDGLDLLHAEMLLAG